MRPPKDLIPVASGDEILRYAQDDSGNFRISRIWRYPLRL